MPRFFAMALEDIDRSQLSQLLPGVRQVGELTLHYQPGSVPQATIDTFAADAQAALTDVETTLDARLAVPVDVYLANGFFPPPDPGVKGYTLSAAHMILLMFDGSGTRQERQYMIAHELTHQIAYDTIGQAATTMLLEGLAMDMEQPYMVRNRDISLDSFARAALADGWSIPLTSLSDGSVGFLGQLFYRQAYEEAGSFVQFLINTQGMAEFKRVYVSGDYVGVYGKSLSELASDWEQYVRSSHAVDQPEPDSATFIDDIARVQQDYHALFDGMGRGIPVSARWYLLLDEARTAADRAGHATVVKELDEFESALNADQS